MALYYASLNSGSNGNCYYVGNENEAVLIDAGISCREIEKRLKHLHLDLKKIKAVFISHEHSDHIRGIEVLSRKHRIPVYITTATHRNTNLFFEGSLLKTFKAYEKIIFGLLEVCAFPKLHDAVDPHSFIVKENELTVGVFTDIGMSCAHVQDNFKQCHAVFLESNYDEHLLETGNYPYHLKQRISSDKGHLSNVQARELFVEQKQEHLTHVLLSHLSKENNSPEKALQSFAGVAGKVKIEIASREEPTVLYCLSGQTTHLISEITGTQMSLF